MRVAGANPGYRGNADRRNIEQNGSEDAFWGGGAQQSQQNSSANGWGQRNAQGFEQQQPNQQRGGTYQAQQQYSARQPPRQQWGGPMDQDRYGSAQQPAGVSSQYYDQRRGNPNFQTEQRNRGALRNGMSPMNQPQGPREKDMDPWGRQDSVSPTQAQPPQQNYQSGVHNYQQSVDTYDSGRETPQIKQFTGIEQKDNIKVDLEKSPPSTKEFQPRDGEIYPKIDEETWQKLGESQVERKRKKRGKGNKLALKGDEPNADKMKQLVKLLAKHINSGEQAPEECKGIMAHASGILGMGLRGKKPEVKPPPQKEEEKKADKKEDTKEDKKEDKKDDKKDDKKEKDIDPKKPAEIVPDPKKPLTEQVPPTKEEKPEDKKQEEVKPEEQKDKDDLVPNEKKEGEGEGKEEEEKEEDFSRVLSVVEDPELKELLTNILTEKPLDEEASEEDDAEECTNGQKEDEHKDCHTLPDGRLRQGANQCRAPEREITKMYPKQSMVYVNENDDHLVQQQNLFAKPIDREQQYNPPIYQRVAQGNNQYGPRHSSQMRPGQQLGNRLGSRGFGFGDRSSQSRNAVSPKRHTQPLDTNQYDQYRDRMGQSRPQSNQGSFTNRMRDRSTGSQRPDFEARKPSKAAWGVVESTNQDTYKTYKTQSAVSNYDIYEKPTTKQALNNSQMSNQRRQSNPDWSQSKITDSQTPGFLAGSRWNAKNSVRGPDRQVQQYRMDDNTERIKAPVIAVQLNSNQKMLVEDEKKASFDALDQFMQAPPDVPVTHQRAQPPAHEDSRNMARMAGQSRERFRGDLLKMRGQKVSEQQPSELDTQDSLLDPILVAQLFSYGTVKERCEVANWMLKSIMGQQQGPSQYQGRMNRSGGGDNMDKIQRLRLLVGAIKSKLEENGSGTNKRQSSPQRASPMRGGFQGQQQPDDSGFQPTTECEKLLMKILSLKPPKQQSRTRQSTNRFQRPPQKQVDRVLLISTDEYLSTQILQEYKPDSKQVDDPFEQKAINNFILRMVEKSQDCPGPEIQTNVTQAIQIAKGQLEETLIILESEQGAKTPTRQRGNITPQPQGNTHQSMQSILNQISENKCIYLVNMIGDPSDTSGTEGVLLYPNKNLCIQDYKLVESEDGQTIALQKRTLYIALRSIVGNDSPDKNEDVQEKKRLLINILIKYTQLRLTFITKLIKKVQNSCRSNNQGEFLYEMIENDHVQQQEFETCYQMAQNEIKIDKVRLGSMPRGLDYQSEPFIQFQRRGILELVVNLLTSGKTIFASDRFDQAQLAAFSVKNLLYKCLGLKWPHLVSTQLFATSQDPHDPTKLLLSSPFTQILTSWKHDMLDSKDGIIKNIDEQSQQDYNQQPTTVINIIDVDMGITMPIDAYLKQGQQPIFSPENPQSYIELPSFFEMLCKDEQSYQTLEMGSFQRQIKNTFEQEVLSRSQHWCRISGYQRKQYMPTGVRDTSRGRQPSPFGVRGQNNQADNMRGGRGGPPSKNMPTSDLEIIEQQIIEYFEGVQYEVQQNRGQQQQYQRGPQQQQQEVTFQQSRINLQFVQGMVKSEVFATYVENFSSGMVM